MIDKPKKYYPQSLLFNRIILAGMSKKTKKFFYTPDAEEKIPTNLEA